jgi:hypothetical protein
MRASNTARLGNRKAGIRTRTAPANTKYKYKYTRDTGQTRNKLLAQQYHPYPHPTRRDTHRTLSLPTRSTTSSITAPKWAPWQFFSTPLNTDLTVSADAPPGAPHDLPHVYGEFAFNRPRTKTPR